ncbi:MAG: transcriptional regulator containing an domain fused to a Zn-ribbon-like protein [Verrucomicrobiales bacterium]|nr:transcriptional regulator containing an domain fused to a Zn-ribbon-like protein [Verrucomicrobiales bacterium]
MLLGDPLTVKEISRSVGQKETTTVDDLKHLFKTVKHQGYKVIIESALCKKCAFEFDATKLNKPSRCPACRSSWVTEPRIKVAPYPDRGVLVRSGDRSNLNTIDHPI